MSGTSPYNAYTRHRYTRGNVPILTGAAEVFGFVIPAWFTSKEVEKLGGKVRDGERSQQIYFAGRFHPKRNTDDDEEGEERKSKFSKDFYVFNIEQCEFGDGVYDHLPDLKRAFAHFAELTEREGKFLESLSQRHYPLTPKQRLWLDDILERLPE